MLNERVEVIHLLVENIKEELEKLNEEDEMSGMEILKECENNKCEDKLIKTFDKSINEFLDGGIEVGKIMEICGLNGIGKSHLCYELMIESLIKSIINKREEKVIYIDSESNFNPFRIYTIIENRLKGVHEIDKNESLNVIEIMKRIIYIRIIENEEMNKLDEIINEIIWNNENEIKMIIIDSICYYYRNEINDTIHRSQKLSKMGLYLSSLSCKYKINIITTNHLSNRIIIDNNNNEYVSVLGDSWSEIVNIRIKLCKMDENLIMMIMKGLNMKNVICYMIDENGLKSTL